MPYTEQQTTEAMKQLYPDEQPVVNAADWQGAEVVPDNDPSLWKDAVVIDAPNNTVLDEKNGRVVSLPQMVSADEAEFLIKRDVDKSKNFFAMQDMGVFEAAGKSVRNFLEVQVPNILAVNKLEKAQLLKSGNKRLFENSSMYASMPGELQVPETDAEEALRLNVSKVLEEDALQLIDRNKKYAAKAGLNAPDETQPATARLAYDLTSGATSTLGFIGLSALTRNPVAGFVFFGALSKSDSYQESIAKEGTSPEAASSISDLRAIVDGGLEAVGTKYLFKALEGNTFVKRFTHGLLSEGVQEGTQGVAEEAIMQGFGIRDKSMQQTAQDVLYQAFLGSIIGSTSAATIGAFVKEKAADSGIPPDAADKLAAYAEKNIDTAKQDMGEFIRKEVAPIAADDKSAMEFMTLMQKFGNNTLNVDRNALEPAERKAFDDYVEIFKQSTSDIKGVASVQKTFFEQATAQGVKEDEAFAASAIVAARADAAARALGITPQEWLQSKRLEVKRTDNSGKAVDAFDFTDVLKTAPSPRFSVGKQKGIKFEDYTKPDKKWDKWIGGVVQELNDSYKGQRIFSVPTEAGRGGDLDVTGYKGNFPAWFQDFNKAGESISREYVNKVYEKMKAGKPLGKKEIRVAETLFREAQAQREENIRQYQNARNERMDAEMAVGDREAAREGDVLFQKAPPIESKEFKKWFGDSKALNKNGEPVVVYHGTRAVFEVFDLNKSGQNGQALGKGFYFTNSRGLAEGYGDIGEFYLSLQNPTFSPTKKTITISQVKKILAELEKHDEYLLSNYGDMESEGRQAVLKRALEDIYDSSKDDADVIASFINLGGVERDIVMRSIIDFTGKDGFITSADIAAMGVKSDDNVYVALLPTQIKSINNIGAFDPNNPNILKQDARGQITFGQDKTLIELFKDSNPSTILHELGHLFLRDMRGIAEQSRRPMVKKDFKSIQEWLGSKDGNFTVEQEEKFARGFEAYLREGKAPKPELQSVFDRFKEWLTSIYKSVRDLDVEINDDIRRVFDRMLGGDFVRGEKQITTEEKNRIDADYAAIAKQGSDDSIGDDAKYLLKDTVKLASAAFTPVSTRLHHINPKLRHAVRKFVFSMGLHSHEDKVKIKPFIEGVSKMSEPDYRMLDLALKNRDTVKVNQLLKQYDLEENFSAVRDTLDDIYNESQEVGLDMNYIQEYFPRQVKNDKVIEYMAAMRGLPEWGELEQAMREKDPQGAFTAEEQAEFANNWLRGFSTSRINLARSSFTKERAVDYVTPEFNKYYEDSMHTLIRYVDSVRHGIESRRLFGKGNSDANIGSYINGLIAEGSIKPYQQEDLKKILKAVVEPQGSRGIASWSKNITYIYLMGSPISAITQIQDLAFSLSDNGYYRTAKAFTKAIARKSTFKKEDVGIENILQEFGDENRAGRSVRAVFKAVGLEWMDNIGKETYMSAAYDRLRAAEKKGGKDFDAEMNITFGAEAAQVKKDLRNGVMSENVKYLMFSELSNVQPISLAEMPTGYLNSGNGRVFYMLKTYTIKQIDIYRRQIFDEIASGEPKRMAKGVNNMIRLSAALMLMGLTSDALKDLILGREIELDDLVLNNMLKLTGLTKYQIYKSKQEGIMQTFWKTVFIPPIGAPIDDIAKDIRKISSGEKDIKDAETAKGVPVVGKVYYWWWGAGAAKSGKSNNSL